MLNTNQQAALDAMGNVAVVAGPGSGKTRVIIAKIGKIYHENSSNRICAVTFTRDAANELANKVKEEFNAKSSGLGNLITQQSRIGTFHSLAIQQLRDANMLGQLATPQNQSAFINQAARSASTPDQLVTYEMAVERIEHAKCSLNQDPAAMADPVVAHYQKLLVRNRISDLYDVIRDAVFGMRAGTVTPMSVGKISCTHLLVDEFQDSDEVQYAWIMEHLSRGVITTVVGDDDQTIFEWRRALGYKGLMAFKDDANAAEVVLGENYRCRSEILAYADTLIRHNKDSRIEKRLTAVKGSGGFVEVISRSTISNQAAALVERMEPFLEPIPDDFSGFQFTVPNGGWCVIARNHGTLHAIEAYLSIRKIKFQRSSGGFWKQYFLVIYLGLLRSIHAGDSIGIDIGLHFCGASNDGIEALHKATAGKFSRFLDGKMEPLGEISKDDQALLKRFSTLSSAWRSHLREGNYELAIRGVASFIADEALYKVTDEDKRSSLDDAADILLSYDSWKIKSPHGDRTPSIAERIDIVLKPRKKDADGIALHTMHSCKGLEFDSVGVLHVSDGLLPNPERADDINDRRLLYVSMTRAKERLYITYKSGFSSRFLQESGVMDIEHLVKT